MDDTKDELLARAHVLLGRADAGMGAWPDAATEWMADHARAAAPTETPEVPRAMLNMSVGRDEEVEIRRISAFEVRFLNLGPMNDWWQRPRDRLTPLNDAARKLLEGG